MYIDETDNTEKELLETAIIRAMNKYGKFISHNIKNYENIPSSQALYNVTGDDFGECVTIAEAIATEILLFKKLNKIYGVPDSTLTNSIYDKLKLKSSLKKQ